MKMENKYYTPSSQEEVISWIFSEAWIKGVTTDPDKNIKIVFDKEQISTNLVWLINLLNSQNIEKDSKGNVLKTSINLKCLRIKYLDKEDIEECEFVHLKEDGSELNFQKIVDDYSFYEIAYDLDEHLLTIEYYYQPEMVAEVTGHVNSEIRFKGTIKNKSELKQILKMIL